MTGLLLLNRSATAQVSSYEELQAVYIFNFAKYIRWPGESKVFVIGVYGSTEIVRDLQDIVRAKRAGGKEIEIRILTSPEEFEECHILYLPESNSKKIEIVREATAGKSILIVTEDDLVRKGAAISFVIKDDRLRFKINERVLLEVGLIPSDGLIKLATQRE